MTILFDCQEIMHEGHCHQYRVSGKPYEEHPKAVEHIYRHICPRDDVGRGVCLIHDVVEDSSIGLRELKSFLSQEVACMVGALTRQDSNGFRCREEQLADYYTRLFTASLRDKRIALVKLADRYHNISTIEFLDQKKALRILEETSQILIPFFRSLNLPMTGMLASLCHQKKVWLLKAAKNV